LLFAGMLLAVFGWLLTSRRIAKDPTVIFLVLAFVTLAELVLPTRAIARYLVFPLVFAIVGTRSLSPKAVWLVVAAITTTALIGMYGSVASGFESAPSLSPALAPANNPISAAALALFRSDVVITLGSLLNVAALFALASAIWFPRYAAERDTPLVRAGETTTERTPLMSP
jgi:hypothetical protein